MELEKVEESSSHEEISSTPKSIAVQATLHNGYKQRDGTVVAAQPKRRLDHTEYIQGQCDEVNPEICIPTLPVQQVSTGCQSRWSQTQSINLESRTKKPISHLEACSKLVPIAYAPDIFKYAWKKPTETLQTLALPASQQMQEAHHTGCSCPAVPARWKQTLGWSKNGALVLLAPSSVLVPSSDAGSP